STLTAGDQLMRFYFEDQRDETRLVATGDEAHPLLVSTKGRLHLLDANTGRWEYESPIQDGLAVAEPYKFEALAAVRTPSGQLELWAGAQRGHLLRRIGAGVFEDQKY